MRNRAMVGPGSKKMGGMGKPPVGRTAMAGKPVGAPPMGKPGGLPGAPPIAGPGGPPPRAMKPPGMGVGMPPPMPGGQAGPPPGPPPGGGGMAGTGGFAKGGSVPKYAKGGDVKPRTARKGKGE